jgi:hypothetical protein
MKKLLIVASLLTAIATPALAQSYSPGYGTGNIAPMVTNQGNQDSSNSYAQAPQETRASLRASHRAGEPSVTQPYGVSGGEGWFSQDGW